MILQALFCYLLDFIAFGLFDAWITFFLLMFLVSSFTSNREGNLTKVVVVVLFVLQNFIMTGRLGLPLLYLMPMFIWAPRINNTFKPGSAIPGLLMLLFCLISHFFIINMFILRLLAPMESTFYIIFANIILMMISLKIRRN